MSRFLFLIYIAFPGLCVELVEAQTASVSAPNAGFFYSAASRSIRPLVGIPGAASLGPELAIDLDFASVAPTGKWALIARSAEFKFVRGLSGPAPAEVAAVGLIENVDRVEWSRDGSTAMVYASSSGLLQRARFSDGDVALDSPIDLTPLGKLASVAMDSAGKRIALGITGGDPGMYLLDAGQSPYLACRMAQPAAAVLDDSGTHLYALDADTQRLLEFDGAAGCSEFASLAGSDQQAVNPAGLALSAGSRYLALVDGVARTIRVYDTSSRSLADTISLDFAPTRVQFLSAGPLFLLNGDGSSGEWLRILDARQSPQVSFVPAGQEEPL